MVPNRCMGNANVKETVISSKVKMCVKGAELSVSPFHSKDYNH